MKELIAPCSFHDSQSAMTYIADCEASFRERVVALAKDLVAVNDLHLIGLSGPTCAGKTTTATLLIEQLQKAGRRVHMISVDDFFREQPNSREKIKQEGAEPPDFDSIDALDFDLFSSCMDELMHTGYTMIPHFDLGQGIRDGFRELKVQGDNDIFFLEGIQVVYPEINELLHHYHYRSIFTHVGKALTVGNVTYAPEHIRFLRRLVRDYYFRSSDASFTFFLWDGVRKNERKSIFPYAEACDTYLESLMGYEIGMLRPHLEMILEQLAPTSIYRETANDILEHISHVQPLLTEWLPPNALYREFVPINE